MDTSKRPRSVYISYKQKKKLKEFIAKHPELISCKVNQNFSHSDAEKLWRELTVQINSIAGAKKNWRQWKKTWQDMKCKMKKRESLADEISVEACTTTEHDDLVLKNVLSTTNYRESEFVPLDDENGDGLLEELHSVDSISEPESLAENKVFTRSQSRDSTKKQKMKEDNRVNENHSSNCIFNCDLLAVQEQRKIQVKEDYYNFKKDYLKQKLVILKEQVEALKSIANALSK